MKLELLRADMPRVLLLKHLWSICKCIIHESLGGKVVSVRHGVHDWSLALREDVTERVNSHSLSAVTKALEENQQKIKAELVFRLDALLTSGYLPPYKMELVLSVSYLWKCIDLRVSSKRGFYLCNLVQGFDLAVTSRSFWKQCWPSFVELSSTFLKGDPAF